MRKARREPGLFLGEGALARGAQTSGGARLAVFAVHEYGAGSLTFFSNNIARRVGRRRGLKSIDFDRYDLAGRVALDGVDLPNHGAAIAHHAGVQRRVRKRFGHGDPRRGHGESKGDDAQHRRFPRRGAASSF
jgi:hypothetical protein